MNDAVFTDTGPLIHLSEIDAVKSLGIFHSINVPEVVVRELTKYDLPGYDILKGNKFKIVKGNDKHKSKAEELVRIHSIGSNDAFVLSFCIIDNGRILLTDDLELRRLSNLYHLRPVGTIGILLRGYREGLLGYDELIGKLKMVSSVSSLYITNDLIQEIVDAANDFRRRSSG